MPPTAIIHLDMDAFFASVEQRDSPELRGKPVIVGGDPRRGVVLAASYEVRPFGVHSAMPMAVAMRRAPKAIVVPPRMTAYEEASDAIFAILSAVTPLIEPLSLDEAFLDVTASVKLFGAPSQIASDLRARIAADVGLPSSAGIASVKFVAKIASDLAKPNGQKEIPPGEARAFLAPLPVGRLWGVGPKTEAALSDLGLRTPPPTSCDVWNTWSRANFSAPRPALLLTYEGRSTTKEPRMKNVMLCGVLCAAFVVATGAGLAGCSSSNSSNTNTSTNTDTNTGTNTNTNAGTETFVASCTYVNTLGTSTITICTDYTTGSGVSAGYIQANCSDSGDTYSSDHCSTTNLIGTCTLPVTGTVVYHYSGGLDTLSADQSGCTGSGGTWANP